MQPNQYDFIMQSAPPPKKGLFGGGNSQKSRILQILALVGVVLIVCLLIISFVSRMGKENTTNLYRLAAAQEDLLNITDEYGDYIKTDSISQKAATLNAALLTQNKETIAAIAKQGVKKPAKQIAPYKVSSYKKVLDDAKVKGTYEDTYKTLLDNRIDDYRAKLQKTYSSSKGAFQKSLASYYQQLKIIDPTPQDKASPSPTQAPAK